MNKIELISLAQTFVIEFSRFNLQLDYSIESLGRIEDYLEATFKDNKPKKGTFFFDERDSRCLALGAYAGEVVRRSGRGIKWKLADLEQPIEIALVTPNGATAFIINKAFKRIYHGSQDNLYHFAVVLLKELLKNESEIPQNYYDAEDIRIEKHGNSPIVIYSKNINEKDGKIHHIYHESGRWYFSGTEEIEKSSPEGYYELMFLSEVKEKHPEFAHLLIAQDKLRIVRQDDGSYRAHKQHKAPFYDSHTIPSYQGDMKLNVVQWIKYNLSRVFISSAILIVGFLLMIQVHWVFVFLFIAALLYNIWYWLKAFNLFKGGDVNPGKVISINPTLVAVATDMRKHSGDYPVLKIIKTQLPREDRELGKIIPTVALYNDNPHGYPFWAEFHPVPVVHGMNDLNYIDHMLRNFSAKQIESLKEYIMKLNVKEVGIYKVDEESSNWANYRHVDLSKGWKLEKPVDKPHHG